MFVVECAPTVDQIEKETGKLLWATMPQIYHVLGLKMQDARDQRRVRKILTIRGWEKRTAMRGGKTQKLVFW
jgi:hypothetical protein